MKRSVGKMFVKGFIQSFFIVAILFGAGILGYKLTMSSWQVPEKEAVVAYQDETVPDNLTQPIIDKVSTNLIYCYNEKTKEIEKIVLEIFQSDTKQLTYITIPMRTQLNISDSFYRKMISVQPAMPQVLQLSAMTSYLDTDTVFDYGKLMVEDLLGTTIDYTTVIPKDTYDTIFISKNIVTSIDNDKGTVTQAPKQQLPVESFSKKYIKLIKTIHTEEDLKQYISDLYPTMKSTMPLEEKLDYLESYILTPLNNISFELIKGEETNSAFIVDKVYAAQQLAELTQGSNMELR